MVLFPLVVYPLLALVGTQLVAARKPREEARASQVAVAGPRALADQRARPARRSARSSFARAADRHQADVDRAALDALVTSRRRQPAPAGQPPARSCFDATRDEGRLAAERLDARAGGDLAGRLRRPVRRHAGQRSRPRTRTSGYLLSKVLPLMILLMVLLGAFYPAIDVTAGERERGTLETVLSAPIPRAALLAGKVLAVTVLASVSGLAQPGLDDADLVQVVNLAGARRRAARPLEPRGRHRLVVLPTAFLLAAVFVAVGSLARGFKEAQNLLMPVYFLFFAPAMLGALGDLQLSRRAALVPGLNVTLLARDIARAARPLALALVVLASRRCRRRRRCCWPRASTSPSASSPTTAR